MNILYVFPLFSLVQDFLESKLLSKDYKSYFSELRNHRPSKMGWAVTCHYCCFSKKKKKLKTLISKCPSCRHLSVSLIGHHDIKHQDYYWPEWNHHHSLVRMRKIRAQKVSCMLAKSRQKSVSRTCSSFRRLFVLILVAFTL